MGLGRRLLGVIVLLLLVAGLVALVTPRDRAASDDVVGLAATRLGEISTYRMEMRFEVPRMPGADDEQDQVVMTGMVDAARDRHQFVGSFGPTEEFETRTVDGTHYVEVRGFPDSHIGTPWAAYPAPRGDLRVEDGALPSARTVLRQLEDAGLGDLEPEKLEGRDVRGAPTSRYRFELRGQQARQFTEALMPADLEVDGELPDISYDVIMWVGDDDLLRMLDMFMLRRASDGAGPTSIHMQTEYFDFGAALPPIEPPPADQVTFFDSAEAYHAALRPGT